MNGMRKWICGRCHVRLTGETAGTCPRCGGDDVVPVDSPRGASIVAALGAIAGDRTPHPAGGPPPSPTTPPRSNSGWVGLVVLIGILVVVAGFLHLVKTEDGLKVCGKESWGLSSTFLDAEDFMGRPVITLLDRASTVRALVTCGVLQLPESWKR